MVRVVEDGTKKPFIRLVHNGFKVWQISWTITYALTSPYKRRNSLDIVTGCEAPPRRRRQGSSERSERSVRFNPNLRSERERVRYFFERETNLQALKRLISL